MLLGMPKVLRKEKELCYWLFKSYRIVIKKKRRMEKKSSFSIYKQV